jgi:hypothetical protein
LSPIYENTQGDSQNETLINTEMRLRGLPDVTDYTNLRAVSRKASRDPRLSTVKFQGRTIGQVIQDSCDLLGINTRGRDVYGQSKALLENMNNYDRESIRLELENHQRANTLS